MKWGRLLVALLSLTLLLLQPARPLHAACSGVTFINPDGGFWDVPGNWSDNAVPVASDDVCIEKIGGVPVLVTVRTPGSANSVTLEEGNSLTIIVENSQFASSLTVTNFVLNDGTITLTCGDSSGGSALIANGALGTRNSATGVINVISGGCPGSTRGITGNVTNDGTINITKSLAWGAAAGGSIFNNNGTITLAAGNTFTGVGAPLTFNQNGGSLNIGSADGFTLIGAFGYYGGAIPGNPPVIGNGSTLDFAAGSAVTTVEIVVANGAVTLLNDIMLGVVVRIQTRPSGGANLNMTNSYTNNGEIWLDGTTGLNNAQLITSGAVTLTNAATGSIKSLPGGGGRVISANVTNLGLISVTNSLDFLGAAGDSAAALVDNQGLFQIGSGVTTTTNSNVTLNQAGNLTVAANATLTAIGTLNQTAGSLNLSSASSVLNLGPSGLNLQGGLLSGAGHINGSIQHNGGEISPGNSPGQLTVNGDYTQGAGSAFAIEIGGVTPAVNYDRMEVSGVVSLAGTLNISFTNGFVPAQGDNFVVLRFGSLVGDFSTTNTTGLGDKQLKIAYNPTEVIVSAVSAKAAQRFFVPFIVRQEGNLLSPSRHDPTRE